MRAYRAVWSPFGAHDQRKRPHKLPDQAVKERPEGRPPLGETAHYTHANPPIKRSSDRAPAPAARPIRRAPRRCSATRAQGAAGTSAGANRGDHPATPDPGWPGGATEQLQVRSRRHGAALRTRHRDRMPQVGPQFAVATAVPAVRSSVASNGSALDRKSSIYPSASGAACGSLTRSGSRWAPRTPKLVVQVGAGSEAGAPDVSDGLPLLDPLPRADSLREPREVGIECRVDRAVPKDDGPSVSPIASGGRRPARRRTLSPPCLSEPRSRLRDARASCAVPGACGVKLKRELMRVKLTGVRRNALRMLLPSGEK